MHGVHVRGAWAVAVQAAITASVPAPISAVRPQVATPTTMRSGTGYLVSCTEDNNDEQAAITASVPGPISAVRQCVSVRLSVIATVTNDSKQRLQTMSSESNEYVIQDWIRAQKITLKSRLPSPPASLRQSLL